MAAPAQANAPPPTADVDEVIQMLIKDGTFDKLRRRLLEELASDAEVSDRADEAVAAEMERRARVGSAGGERPGSAAAAGNGNINGGNTSAAAVTAASFLAAPGARKEVVSRAAADAEDAVTAAALAAAWRILYKGEGGSEEAAGAAAGAGAEAPQQQQQQQEGEELQPRPLTLPAPEPSPSLAAEVKRATERALRRLWDERDGVAAEGGGG